ncbi:MAG: universal stress protein [Dehalococcoidales bacterium]|jgi:nucleotide-binding universal stress UspA family protein
MYERIIVPLDGSKLAEAALPYAEELAAKMGSYISLLTVLGPEEVLQPKSHTTYINEILNVTKYHAEKYVEHTGNKPIEVMKVTLSGDPAETIIKYTSKMPFQLIIMASHGRSGLTRWAVGSVADKVVRASMSQPVMLIRAKKSRSDIRDKRILKKALVPLDGSILSEAVIPYIINMASKLQMEVTLLQIVSEGNHSYADAETYLQSECSLFRELGINVEYKVGVGSAADEIIDTADKLAFDLVAMSTRGKTEFRLWSLGSVAQKVFLGGNTPLLLVKQ